MADDSRCQFAASESSLPRRVSEQHFARRLFSVCFHSTVWLAHIGFLGEIRKSCRFVLISVSLGEPTSPPSASKGDLAHPVGAGRKGNSALPGLHILKVKPPEEPQGPGGTRQGGST